MTIAEHVHVSLSSARTDARVTFPGGDVYSAPIGTPLLEYVKAAFPPGHPNGPILAALVDNELRELTVPVQRDIFAKPVTLDQSDGN